MLSFFRFPLFFLAIAVSFRPLTSAEIHDIFITVENQTAYDVKITLCDCDCEKNEEEALIILAHTKSQPYQIPVRNTLSAEKENELTLYYCIVPLHEEDTLGDCSSTISIPLPTHIVNLFLNRETVTSESDVDNSTDTFEVFNLEAYYTQTS